MSISEPCVRCGTRVKARAVISGPHNCPFAKECRTKGAIAEEARKAHELSLHRERTGRRGIRKTISYGNLEYDKIAP